MLLLAVCSLLLAHQAFADPTESLPGVVDLTPENFDSHVNGGKHVLAEFYAPWCGHCKSLVPEYKKLGELVSKDPKLSSRVVIAKCNADSHRSLGEKYGVQGFPTIKYLPRGKAPTKDNAEDYSGARNAEAFLEYLKKKIEADSSFARVDALADVATKFAASTDKAALIKEAKATVEGLSGEDKANGEIYIKLMEKTVEKGDEYLSKEKARLEKLLLTGSVHASKVEDMSRKTSVLGALLGEE
jgi:protein disulfide-isomerase A6